MPSTAYQHFKEDISRATQIVEHADPLEAATKDEELLRSDLLRSGWMFAVGALDAYLSDAYTWVVGGTLIAKDRQRAIELPTKLLNISLPVTAYLNSYTSRERWRWRMAARRMMDNRNMLNLGAVETAFNPFLPAGSKLFNDVVLAWVTSTQAKQRIFGVTPAVFCSLSNQQKSSRKQDYVKAMRRRFDDDIFQRRHDCIHNCDRPKVAPQSLRRTGTVRNVIRDVEFFAGSINTHLDVEFPAFLRGLGFPAAAVQAATR